MIVHGQPSSDTRWRAFLRQSRTALLGLVTAVIVPFGSMDADAAGSHAPLPSRTVQVPVLERTLGFRLPEGFIKVTDRSNGTNVLIEFVPRGESVNDWTRMVTIQAYRGLGRSSQSTSAIARQAFFPSSCRIGPLYRDTGERRFLEGMTRTLVVNGCSSLPAGAYPGAARGAKEQDFILIFRDRESIYTLNYAERGASLVFRNDQEAEQLIVTLFGNISF